jgi:DNA-binding IclR family transcriptional regulator
VAYEIDAVRKAVAVLRELAAVPGGLGVSELGRRLGLGKASVFRLLHTLAEQGLVRQDAETKRYLLGAELIVLGQAASESLDLRRHARAVMEELSERSGLPAYLNVAGAREVVCLEHVSSLAGIELYGRAGHTMPYHACPSGLVLLAFGPPERVEQVVAAGLAPYGRGTIVKVRPFRAALARVQAEGIAVGVDDLEDGVTSVSAPVCDASGAVVAALGLAGFSHLFEGRLDDLSVAVEEAAARISLGGRRPLAVHGAAA